MILFEKSSTYDNRILPEDRQPLFRVDKAHFVGFEGFSEGSSYQK
ncbi:MAG: hypothetical protein ACFB0B_04120 [Thermonemataceae bacterium]